MVFSNLFFLYFFIPLCFLCYYPIKNIKYRNAVLIIFSLIFYAWGEPLWIILLLASVTMNYFFGRLIGRWQGTPKAKLAVAMSVIVSLLILGVFKYSDFVVENINSLIHLFNADISIPQPNIELPIGISFYTFQILSYTLDAYWGRVKVQKNYFNFLMYVSLFPQLVAGPIVRYGVVEKEINDRKITFEDISAGLSRFVLGLGKKVILANNLFSIVETTLGGNINTATVFGSWMGVICYALYVLFDFSGYSDMAIGLGRMFGFRFNENFNYPFICRNITEFWQRWHISLGSFFRDYLLYVPIFGKRRQYLSLFLVWFSTGLWHGASWNLIIWGLYFGVFIFIERKIGNKRMRKAPSLLMHVYNKIVIVLGFGIFYFDDSHGGLSALGKFFGNLVGANSNQLIDAASQTTFMNNIFLIAASLLFCFPIIPKIREYIDRKLAAATLTGTLQIVGNVSLLVISSIMLVNATNNPFLYFIF